MRHQRLFNSLTAVSRELTFLPRGKAGVFLNNLFIDEDPIVRFTAKSGLKYICDLRSYTENYVPWTGEYEGKTISKILSIVPQDQNIIDIGANVGYWSINLAQHTHRHVFAVEAVQSNAARIREHVALNNFEDKITVINLGVGDSKQSVSFKINEHDTSTGAKTFNTILNEDVKGDIQVELLDTIAKKHKIDNVGFIKIDVEGYEIKALRGATKLINDNRPIIYGEFTPDDIKSFGDKPEELFELLENYTAYQEHQNGFSQITNHMFTRDILLVPNEMVDEVSSKIHIN